MIGHKVLGRLWKLRHPTALAMLLLFAIPQDIPW